MLSDGGWADGEAGGDMAALDGVKAKGERTQ